MIVTNIVSCLFVVADLSTVRNVSMKCWKMTLNWLMTPCSQPC